MNQIVQNTSISNIRSTIASHLIRPIVPIVCVLIFQGISGPAPFDDAFITYRYARNISLGLGFVYNEGEAVLGTTTPLFTFVLAGISRLLGPESIPNASFGISLLADVINVWLVYRLALWAFDRREIAIVASMVFALQPFRINVATGGMETSIFLSFILLTYDRFLIAKEQYSGFIFASLAILTRPDALIAFVPLFPSMLRGDRKSLWRAILLSALVITPWLVWATFRFGSPLPHSITAKATTYNYPLAYAAFFILTFIGTGTLGPYLHLTPVLASSLLVIAVLLVGNSFLAKLRKPILAITIYPIIYGTVMILVNAPVHFPWYYPSLIPGLLFALLAAVWYLPKLKSDTRILLAVLLGIILVSIPALLISIHRSWPLSRESEAFYGQACEILKPELEPMDTVLAPDIGLLGWCLSETKIIDPIGLVTPLALRFSSSLRSGELISPTFIQAVRPDYIVALEQYLNPYLLDLPEFVSNYALFWEQETSNVGTQQTLYIFTRK